MPHHLFPTRTPSSPADEVPGGHLHPPVRWAVRGTASRTRRRSNRTASAYAWDPAAMGPGTRRGARRYPGSMAAPDLDCLFVHTPKADNHYLPFGDFFNITYMPMGLPALADWVRRSGRQTEIVHLGVEWLADPGFDVVRAYDGASIRAIGLSLYWHYQAYDAIEVARALKAAHPEAFVFLGGLTAGYFAEEIVASFPCVDGVLRGHAEGAIVPLLEALETGGDLGAVPALVHRVDGTVVDNARDPRARAAAPALDDLVFGDLSVMRHADLYASQFGFPLAYGREWSRVENTRSLSMGRAFFPLFVGRGCPWLCTFCGGNRDTLRRVNGTNRMTWRSPARVVEDVRRAMEVGYRTMALCFDPTPQKDDYYLDLFAQIRRARLDVDLYFECWGVPTAAFIHAFRETFPSPESYLAVSPDSGSERVRKLNKQPYYDDAALFETLDRLEAREIAFDVFYTIALPGETVADARETARQVDRIAATYRHARRLMTWSVQLEPGSPQFETPERFGMITDRACFRDFYRAHGGDRADTYSSLGYKIQGYFGDSRDQGGIADFERHLQHLKCMELCFLGRDPRFWSAPDQGRQHCFERRSALAERRGHAAPSRPIGEGHDYTDALREEQALRGDRPRHRWIACATGATCTSWTAPCAKGSRPPASGSAWRLSWRWWTCSVRWGSAGWMPGCPPCRTTSGRSFEPPRGARQRASAPRCALGPTRWPWPWPVAATRSSSSARSAPCTGRAAWGWTRPASSAGSRTWSARSAAAAGPAT